MSVIVELMCGASKCAVTLSHDSSFFKAILDDW